MCGTIGNEMKKKAETTKISQTTIINGKSERGHR